MARLRLFGPAREAAGTASVTLPGQSVSAGHRGCRRAIRRGVLRRCVATSKIWLNGEPVDAGRPGERRR